MFWVLVFLVGGGCFTWNAGWGGCFFSASGLRLGGSFNSVFHVKRGWGGWNSGNLFGRVTWDVRSCIFDG